MLSRVAERIYWLGRYMERTENTARLINVNSNLLLDLPRGTQIGWSMLIDIMGCNSEFDVRKTKSEELSIMHFLLSDHSSPVSIMASLRMARENGRTTREIIPTEAWELLNDTYLFARENAGKAAGRAGRSRFLKHIIERAQQFTGLLAGAMSHTSAYDFIRLGRNLERADMSTRIIDVGSGNLITQLKAGLQQQDQESDPYNSILWMSVLQSLSGYQMYRQHVQDRVNAEDVVAFIIQDVDFPRAVAGCLTQLVICLNRLPNAESALHSVASTQRRIGSVDISDILRDDKLHEFIDTVQMHIAAIHDDIAATWFLPVRAESA
ncbi:MAG: alpha-E domain-containing protein [Halioglobus sp.]|nr:alpha-E domain-containing protein [Halioglobus sp.]